jgi:signal transduction histidine kinase
MYPLLKVVNLSKSFGTLPVIKQVNLDVYPGEVVGLAGQSGAGKSVLAMLIAGRYGWDAGELWFSGRRLVWPYPSQSLGIEVIYQQPELVETLDITRNIFLGRELCWSFPGRRWILIPDRRRMDLEAARLLAELNLASIALHKKAGNLASEQRQMVSIAQVMAAHAKLIIVDESTELLSYPNQQKLLSLIQTWRHQGVAVIFCSKDLDHMFAVTDRIFVLRHGQCVADYVTDETTRDQLVADLIGTTDRQQLTPTIWAIDNYYRAREQAEKLHHQQLLLEQNLAAQGDLNQKLIEQLAQQVKALDQANMALQDAQRRLLTEREEERKHLSRELHDQVIQDLLSVNYELAEISGHEAVSSTLQADLGDIRESLRGLVGELRRMCGDLRPLTIDSLGLGAALQSYCRLWNDRTGIPVTLDLAPNLGRLPEAIELSIFRIIQEGLNNVWKHAHAHSATVSLRHTSPRMLMVSLSDDGIGLSSDFDLSELAAQGHYGLLGLSERVALLGGRLKLQNRSEGGLHLQVEIAHPRVEDVHFPPDESGG